jgi:hypothetical protein
MNAATRFDAIPPEPGRKIDATPAATGDDVKGEHANPKSTKPRRRTRVQETSPAASRDLGPESRSRAATILAPLIGGGHVMPPSQPIVAAAVDYAGRGWSVIPLKDDKRPAASTWKTAQLKAAMPADVPAWFARTRGTAGVGIVLGTVSGGLYARDFDVAGAYDAWAAGHPDLARTLPTVQTAKGCHVYGRWPGVRTRTLGDGELRGEGAYVVAPPSPHPSGCFYSWRVPLPDGDVPEVDPFTVGLAVRAEPTERARNRENREYREDRDTESTERTEAPRHRDTEAIGARGSSLLSREDVQDALRRTTPKQRGKRNDAVFRLARALKGLPGLGDLDLKELRPVVKAWHAMALPHINTPDWGTTWGDFTHAWRNIHTPEGKDAIRESLAAAEVAASPEWAADYCPEARMLASLCRELQRRAGVGVWFLSCAKAAECVGVDKGTASRWFKAFEADGALLVVEKGSKKTGRATRFRYVADDLNQSPAATPNPPVNGSPPS